MVTRAGERGSGGALLHNSEVLPAQDEKRELLVEYHLWISNASAARPAVFVSSAQQPLMRKAEKPFDSGDITQSPDCIILTICLLTTTHQLHSFVGYSKRGIPLGLKG